MASAWTSGVVLLDNRMTDEIDIFACKLFYPKFPYTNLIFKALLAKGSNQCTLQAGGAGRDSEERQMGNDLFVANVSAPSSNSGWNFEFLEDASVCTFVNRLLEAEVIYDPQAQSWILPNSAEVHPLEKAVSDLLRRVECNTPCILAIPPAYSCHSDRPFSHNIRAS